ncbi:MAG: hypothetical protein ACREOZ_00870, partial [Gloeomargaritales cyanobacterium]
MFIRDSIAANHRRTWEDQRLRMLDDLVSADSAGAHEGVYRSFRSSEEPDINTVTSLFEMNPDAALLMWLWNSGHSRFSEMNSIRENGVSSLDAQELAEQILQERVSEEVKESLISSYREECGKFANIFSCGACGVRQVERHGIEYEEVSINQLGLLQVNEEDSDSHREEENYFLQHPLQLPIDESGRTETFF